MVINSVDSVAAKYLIKTHYVMKVVAFHPEDQTVDLIQDVFEYTSAPYSDTAITNEFGQLVTVTLKALDAPIRIPVKTLRWGQFEIIACPEPGDTGYIEVFTNDIRDWMENGGPSVPWSDDHFMKTSCVFVPFMPNAKNASPNWPAKEDGSADNTKMIIKSKNASIVFSDVEEEGKDPEVSITTTAQKVNVNAEKGVAVTGDVAITGNLTVDGDLTTTGTITATKDITSTDGDVVASGISLKNHTHGFNYVGAGQGSTPQTGTTGAAQ